MTLDGETLTPGRAEGALLKLDEPLSFWGGVDLSNGVIVAHAHPQQGSCVSGRIVAMTMARGSSSSSSALLELARQGMAPAAVLLVHHDPILVIGALVADELYNVSIPIVVIKPATWDSLQNGAHAHISACEFHSQIVSP